MICPFCLNEEKKVIDKRDSGNLTKRRRECLKCEKRFNTCESAEKPQIRVIKKDGRREVFDAEKLRSGITKACEKRPISSEQITKMISNIQEKIIKEGDEIKTSIIGEIVSNELKKIDKVAYIRFASVYKEFEDISDFKKEIKSVLEK